MQGASRPDIQRHDAWLSRVCGFPCFSMSAPAIGEDLATFAPAQGKAFFFAKVPVADVATLNAYARHGLRVVDVNLVLERTGADGLPGNDDADSVHPASASEATAAGDIAGRCFRQSRFHLDPDFPPELADAIKREWVGSYARGERGSELLVASGPQGTVGFLAVLEQPDVAWIDLVGVAPERQGQGVGRALVREFVRRWAPRKGRLRVGTQAANTGSLRMYESCGFRMAQASYVMHAHARDGRLLK